MDETPAFTCQQRTGAVTSGDIIVVGGTEVKAISLYGVPIQEKVRHGPDVVHLAGQTPAKVWGVDDKGEAVYAAWEAGKWTAIFR